MSPFALLFTGVLAQVGAAAPTSQPSLAAELAQSLAADQSVAAAARPVAAPVGSGNLMNPEISFIGSFAANWAQKAQDPAFVARDDPTTQGLTAQEVEISFSSDVDPYFKMRAFLTLPNFEGVEVEEAYLQTTQLPFDLLLKAGAFRSVMGRNNEQHLHVQDFARRPKVTTMLGEDGLRAPGAQLSLLLPLPWFATLYGEVFSLSPGAAGDQLSGTAVLGQFIEVSNSWSLLVGANAALFDRGPAEDDPMRIDPGRDFVLGGDVYLKWKPPNQVDTYTWCAFTGEYFARRESAVGSDWDGIGYGQLVVQVARRWRFAARLDVTGIQSSADNPRATIPSASIAFLPSEFSRIRLTGTHEDDDTLGNNTFVTLQYEAAIGAHGAHPF